MALFSALLIQWGSCQIWANQTRAPYMKRLICYKCEGFDIRQGENPTTNVKACRTDHFSKTSVPVYNLATNDREEDMYCYKVTLDDDDWNNGTEWVARGIITHTKGQFDNRDALVLAELVIPDNYKGGYHYHYCEDNHCNSATVASTTVLATIVTILAVVRVI